VRKWLLGISIGLALASAAAVGGDLLMSAPGMVRHSANAAARGCDVTITSPALDVGRKAFVRSTDSLGLAFSGLAQHCPSSTISYYQQVGDGGETLVDAGTTSATGGWTFSLAATDQTSTVFSARMTSGALTTQAQAVIDADTRLPKVVIASPAPDSASVLRVVAPLWDAGCGGGNQHVIDGEPGWVADTSCADGGQVAPDITVTGASGGWLSVSYAGTPVIDAGINATPKHFTSADLGVWTLPDLTRGDLVITATNDAGSTSRTLLTRVLATSPAPVLGPDGGQPSAELLEARAAKVRLSYVLPTVPAGLDSTTEVAWTISARLGASPTYLSRTNVLVTTSPTAIADPATAGRSAVAIHNCATTADGGGTLWCSTSPSVAVDAGVRIPFTVSATCSSTDGSSVPYLFDTTAGGDGGLGWNGLNCGGFSGPNATLYCVSETGTSRAWPQDHGICQALTATNYIGGNPPMWQRSIDCALDDAAASPQVWDCQGTKLNAGQTRSVTLTLPPLNTYFFLVRAVY
jgi:hypothetical protein